MNKSFLNNSNKDKGESWLNVSDMMAGLMMVFLLIVVIYARNANKDTQNRLEDYLIGLVDLGKQN